MAAHEVYVQELLRLAHGYPMWHADPYEEYEEIKPGDLGYIDEGKFYPLRNVLPGATWKTQLTRLDAPQPLTSEAVSSASLALEVSGEGANANASAQLAYVCHRSQGALLELRDGHAVGVDCDRDGKGVLGQLMLSSYKDWLVDHPYIGCDELILITGCHKTRDWQAAVFNSSIKGKEVKIGGGFQIVSVSASLSLKQWKGHRLNFSSGHHHQDRENSTSPPCCDSPQNQYIFLRGWRLRERKLPFAGPKLIKAAAEPKDLDKPDPDSDNSPAVAVELDHFPPKEQLLHNSYDDVFEYIFTNSDVQVAMVHDDHVIEWMKIQEKIKPTKKGKRLLAFRKTKSVSPMLQYFPVVTRSVDNVNVGLLSHIVDPFELHANQSLAPKRDFMDNWRISLLGDGGVGKTAIAVQYTLNCFVETYDPTIEDCYRKQAVVDRRMVFVEAIDTSGQEEYATLRDQWCREAQGFVMVYSIASRSTFDRLSVFYQAAKRVKKQTPVCILVGNKSDKTYEREVSKEEGKALADEMGCPFLEASAKTAYNIESAFSNLIRSLRSSSKPHSLAPARANVDNGPCVIS